MSKSQQSERTTSEEVYGWIRQLQQNENDEMAKENLVLQYEGLVHSLARKYSYNRGNHEDLVQVGMIGLLVAAERFDSSLEKHLKHSRFQQLLVKLNGLFETKRGVSMFQDELKN